MDSPWISLHERVDKLMDNSLAGKPAASYPQLDPTNPPPAHTPPDKHKEQAENACGAIITNFIYKEEKSK